MARLRDIVVDGEHPASLPRFWAAALDRLIDLGARPADAQLNGDLVVMRDPEGNELCLLGP